MPTSPILQLKISETKKRLSKPIFNEQTLWCLGLSIIVCILTYAGRVVTMGSSWGMITLDIPVAAQPFVDTTLHSYEESAQASIGSTTMVVALTPSELIFGDLAAFTTHRDDVRNKFLVPHKEGSPQVTDLLKQSDEWENDRKRRLGIRPDGLLIILPDPVVPVAIVSIVAEALRKSGKFTHVILGGGLL